MSLEDFEILNFYGKGSFEKLYRARKKNGDDKDQIYFLKQAKTIYYKYFEIEKHILGRIKHPFLVQQFYSFETETKIYLVEEFVPGGSLCFYLTNKSTLFASEEVVAFYIKEIIIAIEYLHSEKIIYKKLCPCNILLDKNGHIKLADFTCSEENFPNFQRNPNIGFCLSGYEAPEQFIKGCGHGFAVDWWALGALLYQMMVGKPPFVASNSKELVKRICNGNFKLPCNISSNASDLIRKLLTLDETRRLGYAGAEAIKRHPFFENTCWESISKCIEPPPLIPEFYPLAEEEDISDDDISMPFNFKEFCYDSKTQSNTSDDENESSRRTEYDTS